VIRQQRARRALIVALAMAGVVVLGATASYATAAPAWSPRVLVDRHPLRYGSEALLLDISCPTESLCVAVGPHGAFESLNPTAVAPIWSAVPGSPSLMQEVVCPSTSLCVAGRHLDAIQDVVSFDPTYPTRPTLHQTHLFLSRFACPSVALCVGSDGAGGLLISTDPGATHPTWRHYPTVYESREGSGLSAMSCASVRLCLGVDTRGQLVSSTDPGASVPHWHVNYAPGPYLHNRTIGRYLLLTTVACPSTTFCMATDENGKAYTSSDPGAARPTWTKHPAPAYIDRLSCPSMHLCVGNIHEGVVVATNDPTAARPRWTRTTLPDEAPGSPFDRSRTTLTCIPASTTCVAAEGSGYVIAGSGL
jgi:hypothetical protein